MDSIDREQPEPNRADLRGPAAVARIREIVDRAKNCFFCTASATAETGGARPMNVRPVDDAGTVWFLSAADSGQNREVASDSTGWRYFQGAPPSDFLHLTGRATVPTARRSKRCGSRS